jgi:hypothetical protein
MEDNIIMNTRDLHKDISSVFPQFRGFQNGNKEFRIPSYYKELFQSDTPILGFGFYGPNKDMCQVELHKNGQFYVILPDTTLYQGIYYS